jgi:ABC-type arginine transport system permease subunit
LYSLFLKNTQKVPKIKTLIIYSYSVSIHEIEKIYILLGIFISIIKVIDKPDIILILKIYYQKNNRLKQWIKITRTKAARFILKSNSSIQ